MVEGDGSEVAGPISWWFGPFSANFIRLMRTLGGWFLAFILVLSTLFVVIHLSTPGRLGPWRSIPPSPLKGRMAYADAVVADRVMIWGGQAFEDGVPRFFSDGALFDLQAWTWKPMSQGPLKPCRFAEALEIGGRILLLAGNSNVEYEGMDCYPDAAWYDPKDDTWSRIEDCPITNCHRRVVRTPRGVAVWKEADDESDFAGSFFEVESGVWKPLKSNAVVSFRHFATAVIGNMIFFWGGIKDEQPTSEGAVLDVERHEWRPMPKSPLSPRYFARAFEMGSKILFWGGLKGQKGPGITIYPMGPQIDYMDGAVFDTERETWSLLPPPPKLGDSHNARTLDDHTILIWGEQGLATYSLGEIDWKILGTLEIPRQTFGQRIMSIGDSRVLGFSTWSPSGRMLTHFGPLWDHRTRSWKALPSTGRDRPWVNRVPTSRGLMLWGGGYSGGMRMVGETKWKDAETYNDGVFLDLGLLGS